MAGKRKKSPPLKRLTPSQIFLSPWKGIKAASGVSYVPVALGLAGMGVLGAENDNLSSRYAGHTFFNPSSAPGQAANSVTNALLQFCENPNTLESAVFMANFGIGASANPKAYRWLPATLGAEYVLHCINRASAGRLNTPGDYLQSAFDTLFLVGIPLAVGGLARLVYEKIK